MVRSQTRHASAGRATTKALGRLRGAVAAMPACVAVDATPSWRAAPGGRRADDASRSWRRAPECPGCVVVNAKGEITDDTSRDFAMFLAETRLKGIAAEGAAAQMPPPANTPQVIVAFESVGGKVVPALVIGRRIRQLGWTTIVGRAATDARAGVVFDGAGCYSACSMVMLGGVERYVAPGSPSRACTSFRRSSRTRKRSAPPR